MGRIVGALLCVGASGASAEDLTPYTRDPVFLKWAAETWPGGSHLLPKIDGQWRVIERTDEASTSTCIGRPISPLCALDTYEACSLRGGYDLCFSIYNVTPLPYKITRENEPKFHWRIRPVMTRHLSAQDIRDWRAYHRDKIFWRVGDVAIGFVKRNCYDPFEDEASRDCEKPDKVADMAVFRRTGHAWHIVSKRSSTSRVRKAEFD